MAITQVRVRFNGQWYTLTFNEATQRYEGEIVPQVSSHSQSGGYYGLTVEASNDTGQISSIDAGISPALRLVVKEATEPTITLVSPPQGYLATSAPSVIFTITDEAGGSGVDLRTLRVALDGKSAAYTNETIERGYRITCALSALSDGPHTITAEVSDHDGNQATAKIDYIVDTKPPELHLTAPNHHRIIDEDTIAVAGTAMDTIARPVVVRISRNGEELGKYSLSENGMFFHAVPLPVGVSSITVTATDAAGLVSTETFRVFRMVTDRTQEDLDHLLSMLENGNSANKLQLLSNARGSYDYTDLNRVTAAMGHLNALLTEAGYQIEYVPVYPDEGRTEWNAHDTLNKSAAAGYLKNVDKLRNTIPASVPATPSDMNKLHYEEANDIEKILVGIDTVHHYLEVSQLYAGEIYCGEV